MIFVMLNFKDVQQVVWATLNFAVGEFDMTGYDCCH